MALRGGDTVKLVELKKEILEKGYTQKEMAEKLGISVYSWQKKLSGKVDFWRDEIERTSSVLHLSAKRRDDIFFN